MERFSNIFCEENSQNSAKHQEFLQKFANFQIFPVCKQTFLNSMILKKCHDQHTQDSHIHKVIHRQQQTWTFLADDSWQTLESVGGRCRQTEVGEERCSQHAGHESAGKSRPGIIPLRHTVASGEENRIDVSKCPVNSTVCTSDFNDDAHILHIISATYGAISRLAHLLAHWHQNPALRPRCPLLM